jgi:hypothetical protein
MCGLRRGARVLGPRRHSLLLRPDPGHPPPPQGWVAKSVNSPDFATQPLMPPHRLRPTGLERQKVIDGTNYPRPGTGPGPDQPRLGLTGPERIRREEGHRPELKREAGPRGGFRGLSPRANTARTTAQMAKGHQAQNTSRVGLRGLEPRASSLSGCRSGLPGNDREPLTCRAGFPGLRFYPAFPFVAPASRGPDEGQPSERWHRLTAASPICAKRPEVRGLRRGAPAPKPAQAGTPAP